MSYLVDTSALTRRHTRPEVREVLEPLLLEGEVATCAVVDLEVLHGAVSRDGYRTGARVLQGMPRAHLDEWCAQRALEVQAMLAERSQHRAVPLQDLLIAACAERSDLIVLHYDADFERIAELTDQPQQWIAPRGSVS